LSTVCVVLDRAQDVTYVHFDVRPSLSHPCYGIIIPLEDVSINHSFVLLDAINVSRSCYNLRIFLDVGLNNSSALCFLLSVASGVDAPFWITREETSVPSSHAVPILL
jgi:hypothetical protein